MLSSTLVAAIVEQLGVPPEDITPDAEFIADLNADSLDLVELTMTFEERFGVTIEDEEAERMKTVGDVQRWLEDMAPNALAKADASSESAEITKGAEDRRNTRDWPA